MKPLCFARDRLFLMNKGCEPISPEGCEVFFVIEIAVSTNRKMIP